MNRDEKLIELLTKIGLHRNLAKAIVYLSKVKRAKAKEVERNADLRQPEVSLTMKNLKERKWVREREVKRKGKGRPTKEYELIVSLRDIVKELVNAKREELNELKAKLSELEKLLNLK
jgi:predicted transcriptional regulator